MPRGITLLSHLRHCHGANCAGHRACIYTALSLIGCRCDLRHLRTRQSQRCVDCTRLIRTIVVDEECVGNSAAQQYRLWCRIYAHCHFRWRTARRINICDIRGFRTDIAIIRHPIAVGIFERVALTPRSESCNRVASSAKTPDCHSGRYKKRNAPDSVSGQSMACIFGLCSPICVSQR